LIRTDSNKQGSGCRGIPLLSSTTEHKDSFTPLVQGLNFRVRQVVKMAYSQRFNPDSLPAFAEPERKQSNTSSANSTPAPGPTHPQAQQAVYSQQYGQKPPPPLPTQQNYHSGQPSPKMQPPANYGYGGSTSPPPHHGVGSPPPGAYGVGRGRPLSASRPPPSPAPPAGADPTLWPLFKAVDKDGTASHALSYIVSLMLLQVRANSPRENWAQPW